LPPTFLLKSSSSQDQDHSDQFRSILVVDDLLGMFTDFRPKFVKRYAELGQLADAAIAAYAADVRARAFPAPEHGFADAVPKAVK
jgi:ketopantoate hydroxymethyltransferase